MTESRSTRPGDLPTATWWREAVVYQVYPRSFADGNGDGIGDLLGIQSRVDYLASLGVDAVWLSPFYPSGLADGGYDIDDYRDVDPVIGDLAGFDQLVAALRAHGIRTVVDIVPNHSSHRHPWFQEALRAAPGSPERARYLFRDGRGPDGNEPPSDWPSFFGGPAWTRVADGQWYLHLFTAQQPDWNWRNAEVRADFRKTLRFWGDRGVDGFRVDVAHLLAKDLPAELPSWAELTRHREPGEHGKPPYSPGAHPLWDRDELDDIYREWRTVLNSYPIPKAAVAEAWVPAERRARYAASTGLGQAFNFDLLEAPWDSVRFRAIIQRNLDLAEHSGTSSTWVLSNHDVVRHPTRFGLAAGTTGKQWLAAGADPTLEDRETGLRRARAATLLALALPGSMYLFQGEELGLPEVGTLSAGARQDPVYFRSSGADVGRDGARVPLPWTETGTSFGFGTAAPHLPQPAWFGTYSVQAQEKDPDSTLLFYRAALRARRELRRDESLEWLELGEGIVAFQRSDAWISITNFRAEPAELPPGRVIISSERLSNPGIMPPNTTLWMRKSP